MPHNIDIAKISDLLVDVANEHIVPRFKMLQTDDISTKTGPEDLVTIADKEAEVALERALTLMHPGSIVIGEEGVSEGRVSLAPLDSSEGIVWVTDPVDGTWNFVHGKDEFAVMLACVIDGVTRYSWIYDVPGNRMLMAEKGNGATLAGQPLRTAAYKPMAQAEGYTGMRYFPDRIRPALEEGRRLVKDMRSLRCAGHEYIRIASGAVDFGLYGRCRPWDHLPGTLAVQEAGGHVAVWTGAPYKPQSETVRGMMVAGSQKLWDEMYEGFVRNALQQYIPKV